MSKRDPYMLSSEEAKKQAREQELVSNGIICPKRNLSIGGRCYVCDALAKIFQTTTKGSPKWKLAAKKAAKAAYFLNVVFPENPEKVVLLQIGKDAGNVIIHNNEKDKWLDIAHPKAGKGREMEITKTIGGDNYPKYSISPMLEHADWDIPEEVLNNLYNLDEENLIKIIQEGTVDIYKVSKMKADETMSFRICPPWRNGKLGDKNRRIMTAVFRHWGGVTQEEVDGKEMLDLSVPEEIEESGLVTSDEPNVIEDKEFSMPELQEKPKTRRRCFGKEDLYDSEDQMCIECPDRKECVSEIKRSMR